MTTAKQPHPYAAIFPMMTAQEHTDLVADIKAHGLRSAISLNALELVIDGRNREKACIEAGVEPDYETLAIPDRDLLAWIVSHNLHRRQLQDGQRAAVAAELANLTQGGRGGHPTTNPPIGGSVFEENQEVSAAPIPQALAAKTLNVSERSVQRAKRVKDADGVLHEQVKAGEVTLAAAEKTVKARVPRAAAAPRGSEAAIDKQKATRNSNKAIRDLVRWESSYQGDAKDDLAIAAAIKHVRAAITAARTARPDAGAIKV